MKSRHFLNACLAFFVFSAVPVWSQTADSIISKARERFLHRGLDETADLYIDAETFLLLRSVRLQQSEQAMDVHVPITVDYTDYRRTQGAYAAYKVVETVGGGSMRTYQVITTYT